MSPSRERPSKKIFSFDIFYFKGRKKGPIFCIMPLGFVGSQVTPAKISCPQVLLKLGVSIWFKFLGPNKKGCGRVDNVVRKQDGILMIGGRSESNNTTSCTKEISGSVTCPPHSTTTSCCYYTRGRSR
jgi:hypothetical protein